MEELEALRACYPDLLTLAPAEADNLRFAAAVAAGSSSAAPADVPSLSGTLQLPDTQLAGAPVLLKFVLGAAPSLQVITNAGREAADSLQQLATSTAEECTRDSVPCLLVAAGRLAAAAEQLADAEVAERQRAGEQPPSCSPQQQHLQRQAEAASRELTLSRRCIWFHHIKAQGKRKAIVEWGKELGLGGLSKPGFPGVLLVEVSAGDPCAASSAVAAGVPCRGAIPCGLLMWLLWSLAMLCMPPAWLPSWRGASAEP